MVGEVHVERQIVCLQWCEGSRVVDAQELVKKAFAMATLDVAAAAAGVGVGV